jgi:hypothetical protein
VIRIFVVADADVALGYSLLRWVDDLVDYCLKSLRLQTVKGTTQVKNWVKT